MTSIRPEIIGRGSPGNAGSVQPLLVRPRVAWLMLGCGNTHGYELLNSGELESFLDGKSRKIVVASIHSYIARRLAGANDEALQRRRRKRSRKLPATEISL